MQWRRRHGLVEGLPGDLPAAVPVIVHMAVHEPRQFVPILERAGPLPAAEAQDGEAVRPGRIYVARRHG